MVLKQAPEGPLLCPKNDLLVAALRVDQVGNGHSHKLVPSISVF